MENLKEKIDFLRLELNFPTQKEFAEFLEIHEEVLSRNLKGNKLTQQLIFSLRDKIPRLNFNWLIKNSGNALFLDEKDEKEINSYAYTKIKELGTMLSILQEELHEYDTKNK